jgi:hypothetical protein
LSRRDNLTSKKKALRSERSLSIPKMKNDAPAAELSAAKSLQKLDAPANLQRADEHGGLMTEASRLVASMYGVRDMKLAAHLVDQVIRTRAAWSSGHIDDPLEIAMTMLLEMKPETIMEALLAVQMAAVHQAGMLSLQKAAFHSESSENPDLHMDRATRLMRLFIEQIDAMARLKGKTSQQKVTVEHVHIHKGGQAIVGAVSAPGGKKEEESGIRQIKPA